MDEFTVKKIVCREFGKVQFSFSFSLWNSREKKNKQKNQAFAKVQFSYSFSLWYNENNQCKLSFAHLKLKDRVF